MKKITIKFVDYDGYLYAKVKKDVNKPFTQDIQVAPIVEIYETRRFSRWSQDIDSLTQDTIVNAVYETIYPFVFQEIDGKLYLVDSDPRCMNTMYVVPQEYAGKKVVGIMPGAFKPISANASSIFIPIGCKDIKDGAFDSCYNTTFVFEAKERNAGFRKECANFDAKVFFNASARNHFVSEEFEYVVKNGHAVLIRCLECYGATVVPDRVRNGNQLLMVEEIDDYAFYNPSCSDFYEIYIPSNIDIDKLKDDYIYNSEIIPY